MKLVILRKVNWDQLPKTITVKNNSTGARSAVSPTYHYCESHEHRKPYFSAGFVNNDLPRAVAFTEDLRLATPDTGGFALADETGNIVVDGKGEPYAFDTVAQAEQARAGATVAPAVSITLPEQPNFGERMKAAREAKAAAA